MENKKNPDYLSLRISIIFYLIRNHKSEAIMAHLRDNIKIIMERLIEENDVENIVYVLDLGYITKDNIDIFIQCAIENKKPEIQVILSNYKNDNFGFKDNLDEFLL